MLGGDPAACDMEKLDPGDVCSKFPLHRAVDPPGGTVLQLDLLAMIQRDRRHHKVALESREPAHQGRESEAEML